MPRRVRRRGGSRARRGRGRRRVPRVVVRAPGRGPTSGARTGTSGPRRACRHVGVVGEGGGPVGEGLEPVVTPAAGPQVVRAGASGAAGAVGMAVVVGHDVVEVAACGGHPAARCGARQVPGSHELLQRGGWPVAGGVEVGGGTGDRIGERAPPRGVGVVDHVHRRRGLQRGRRLRARHPPRPRRRSRRGRRRPHPPRCRTCSIPAAQQDADQRFRPHCSPYAARASRARARRASTSSGGARTSTASPRPSSRRTIQSRSP